MLLEARDIAAYCAGDLLGGAPDRVIRGLSWDSRTITPDCLYVAIPGQQVDGHDFCLEAVRGGAAAVLVSRMPGPQTLDALTSAGACTIHVEDTHQALSQLAHAWRKRLQGQVIALSGSSGKTTTKNLVRDVLAAAGTVVATKANQNNELGVPATLLTADEDTQFIVVEMGMRGEGQLAALCEIAQPSAALVTNVGTSHIELLGSQDAIARAKAEPFQYLSPHTGTAFINASDAFAPALVEYGKLAQREVRSIFFDGSGTSPDAYHETLRPSIWAEDIRYDAAGNSSFTIHIPGSSAPCSLQLAGGHNIHNALAAAAIGYWAGLDATTIAAALQQSVPAAGRQQIIDTAAGVRVIDDSYNANPDSTCASLDAFARMDVDGQRIAVLGDMLELGTYAQEGHERVGRKAVSCGLDRLMCVGSLSHYTARAAQEAGLSDTALSCVDNAQEALDVLQESLHDGDCVLIKASHSIGLHKIVEGLGA